MFMHRNHSVKMHYLVDLVGFKQSSNNYILKEFSFVPAEDDLVDPLVLLFKQPFPWRRLSERYQKINFWLKFHHHGLEWNSGKFPYQGIKNILYECLHSATKVLVDSEIKKEWLKRFGFEVENIFDYGYSTFKKPKQVSICLNHDATCKINCAFHNVKFLKKFYKQNFDEINYEDFEIISYFE